MFEAAGGRGARRRWSASVGEYVRDLRWSPNGKRLAVASADGMLAVYADDGTRHWSVHAHGLATTSVAWAGADVLISGGEDGQLRVWSAQGEALGALGLENCVDGLHAAPDGARVAVRAGRRLVVVEYRADAGVVQQLDRYEHHSISDVHWRAEPGRFATSSYCRLRMHDVAAAEPIRELSWQGSMISLAISPDERFAAVGTQEQSVHLWNLDSGEELYMAGFAGKVHWLGWTADGRWLATASGGNLIHWDCSDGGPQGREPWNVPVHPGVIRTMVLHPQRSLAASGDQVGMLLVTRVPDGRVAGLVNGDGGISRIDWRSDGASLAVGTAEGTLGVWTLASG